MLLVQWAPITRKVLEALPRVKCIVRYGVGVNNFDLDAAKDLGVTAANVPDFCLHEVSDHAMSFVLNIGRRIIHDHNQIMKGGWGINPFRPIPAFSDMTIGLVSFGQIARLVAKKAQAFNFSVVAFDPWVSDEVFAELGVKKVDMDTLLKESDVVSLHCPLTPQTTHLINAEALAKMKDGSILVNTSRGPVVDEKAMIEALKSGKLVGAGLDVFEDEPLPADSPLRSFDNVILTSHAASVSEKAVDTLQINAATSALEFVSGKRPRAALV